MESSRRYFDVRRRKKVVILAHIYTKYIEILRVQDLAQGHTVVYSQLPIGDHPGWVLCKRPVCRTREDGWEDNCNKCCFSSKISH